MKKIYLLLVITFLVSCEGIGKDPIIEGFKIQITNDTSADIDGKIIIGSSINNSFIPTDSIDFEYPIPSGSRKYFYIDENRWKPNLDKIRNIPADSCVFKFKLTNGREDVVTKTNTTSLLSINLPEIGSFEGDYGSVLIVVEDNNIRGRVAKEY